MEKVSLILLICIYSLATMGFSLKEFYCCGKLKSVTVEVTSNQKKSCNKGNDESHCCDNKYQFYKVKDNHLSGKAIDIPLNFLTDLELSASEFQPGYFVEQEIDIINGSHAPPMYMGVPIYISNCVFRI